MRLIWIRLRAPQACGATLLLPQNTHSFQWHMSYKGEVQ
jgi:hypothetical protein